MSRAQEKRTAVVATKDRHASFRRTTVAEWRLIHSFPVGSLDRQLRFLPSFPTSGNVPEFLESRWFQNARRDARSITAATINRRRFVPIELTHSLFEFRNKNVPRAGNVTSLPFTGSANIDNLQRRFLFVQFKHAHLRNSLDRKPGRVPRFHSVN